MKTTQKKRHPRFVDLSQDVILRRLALGWSVDEALSTPLMSRGRNRR